MDFLVFQYPMITLQACLDGILLGVLFALIAYGMALQWGIMNSFQSIAISRNTSLAIVAPGIAEALFATALGLLAAIPAVIAYNRFNTESKKYFQKLESFSKRFISIV